MALRRFKLAVIASHVVPYHSSLYRELSRSDRLEVTVLYLDKAGRGAALDPRTRIRTRWGIPLLEGYKYEFLKNWSPFKSLPFVRNLNPDIVPRLWRRTFDAVLIQSYDRLSCWLAFLAARLGGAKTVFRGEANLRAGRSALTAALKYLVVKAVIRTSDAVFYGCTGNRRFFEHYGCPSSKLHLMPCAVDNEFFREQHRLVLGRRCDLRKELAIPPDTPVAIMVAHLDTNKRQADLLSAAGILQKKGRDVAVVLVGDGPERASLAKRVACEGLSNVNIVGFKSQYELPHYYAAADIFVLCSEYDASPKCVNEALNFYLPIVSTDRPGTVGDTIVEGENAFIYEVGDAQQLADCLDRLIRNPELGRAMGRRSREISDEWSLEADVAQMVRVLDMLFAHRPSTSAQA
jgi:glycosyltransferase involved in cell wall biosynthesis